MKLYVIRLSASMSTACAVYSVVPLGESSGQGTVAMLGENVGGLSFRFVTIMTTEDVLDMVGIPPSCATTTKRYKLVASKSILPAT